jgi:hypothetical protein
MDDWGDLLEGFSFGNNDAGSALLEVGQEALPLLYYALEDDKPLGSIEGQLVEACEVSATGIRILQRNT